MRTTVYVEKKPGYRIREEALLREIREVLSITGVQGLRVIQRYDLDGLPAEHIESACVNLLADPVCDIVSEALPISPEETAFAYAYHPGQFDQRADSAAEGLRLISGEPAVAVRCVTVIALRGTPEPREVERIRSYLVNPVDSHTVPLRPNDAPGYGDTVRRESAGPRGPAAREEQPPEPTHEGLRDPSRRSAAAAELGLAMSAEDLDVLASYFFDKEARPPTETELRVIDTYWSDHCRHTTFLTELSSVEIEEGETATSSLRRDYERYRVLRRELGEERPESLMDMATIVGRVFRARGLLSDLEVSEEVNAASLRVRGPGGEPWLLMFKNETHNHPTEIEPFGGASTCLGGVIRDPLSGRSYVYQALRMSGGADPRTPVEDTLPGKLPQRTIATEAARGFSSYGNQIGLPTGHVREVYHPDYVAKRLEAGAVCGAAPASHVRRAAPQPGDRILLVGGRTGRDGCGGATGSSKAHTESSIEQAGAEVQKGNPPVERALQRLFRREEAASLVKRCNDFGAGGVSVAVGELATGVDIDLDAVPVKYRGLSATELAISESQERMAVVIDPDRVDELITYADAENLEATVVARVTDTGRMRMYHRGETVVDIARELLDSHGAPRRARARLPASTAPPQRPHGAQASTPPEASPVAPSDVPEQWLVELRKLSACSARGLLEMFDSTVGAGTVLLPLGGRRQTTREEAAVTALPASAFARKREGAPVSGLACGFDPDISRRSPYRGGYLAVVESVCRLLAVGAELDAVRLSLQEFFPRPGDDPQRWGLPAAALLGAIGAQLDLGVPAVGGKDSMSGSYEELDVPPTLVSFAVAVFEETAVTPAEFQKEGSAVILLDTPYTAYGMPDAGTLRANARLLQRLRRQGALRAAGTIRTGGLAAALTRGCVGNHIGVNLEWTPVSAAPTDAGGWFTPRYGSFYAEIAPEAAGELFTGPAGANTAATPSPAARHETALPSTVPPSTAPPAEGRARPVRIGTTGGRSIRSKGFELSLSDLEGDLDAALREVFPLRTDGPRPAATWTRAPDHSNAAPQSGGPAPSPSGRSRSRRSGTARPRVVVPVFPGTNCELDTVAAFEDAGAVVRDPVFRNRSPQQTTASVEALAAEIREAQILVLPGGFSAGDEPDGSGKYIAAAFRTPRLAEAVTELIEKRDGLVLGICNGFQALIRLGLLPYGEIRPRQATDPVLAHNSIGRHVATMVYTRVTSRLSPWLRETDPTQVYAVPVSHGEGRFVCEPGLLRSLWGHGQIAAQYVDSEGNVADGMPWNPNGSVGAIEAISSPDGRVLGKMGHTERLRPGLYRNFPDTGKMGIFESGVRYFA
ncbi:MAG: phosphoribosylformylglycinamidine synthase [Spirochaetaceae bacterium]